MAIKLILQVFGLTALALIGVVVFNTMNVGSRPEARIPAPLKISVDTDAAAQRLAQAVRYRTISNETASASDGVAFRALHDFVEVSYPRVHESLKRETVADLSLLYTWQSSDPSLKPILLNAHMDVVPIEPGTESDWTLPPFSGAIADGFIWGRGTMDMKASLMGILEAAEYLITQGFVPARTVYLTFSHDEEAGGSNGTAKIAELLEGRGVRLDYTLDEGLIIAHGIVPGVAKPVALVGLAEKGAVVLELSTRVEGGHSSRPPMSTAIGKLAQAIQRLETNQMPARLDSPVADMFTYLAPEMPFAWRVVFANRWLSDPWLISRLERSAATNASIRTTTAPTIIQGGVKSNVLPSHARAVVDFRILPGDTIASVMEHVRATIDDSDITIRQVGREPSDPSPVSGVETLSFTTLRKTIRQIFPDVVVAPGLVIGRTDSRHYAKFADNSYRFLPMRLGPEDVKRIHGVDERIAVDNYLEIVRFYIQLLRNIG